MQASKRIVLLSAALTAAVGATAYAQMSGFGGDKIKLPADIGALYTTVDRADNKQVREIYGTTAAIDAAKKGQPLPNGSALTMVVFKAKLDAKGDPEKAANGRFVKDELVSYFVMEKQTGYGAGIPAELRNGTWEYQVFTPAKAVNDKANLKACFECHRDKAGMSKDYVFSLDKMAGK